MKQGSAFVGFSAAELDAALDKVAVCIDVLGPERGRALLPIYARLERELATIRAEEDTLAKAMARLSRITAR